MSASVTNNVFRDRRLNSWVNNSIEVIPWNQQLIQAATHGLPVDSDIIDLDIKALDTNTTTWVNLGAASSIANQLYPLFSSSFYVTPSNSNPDNVIGTLLWFHLLTADDLVVLMSNLADSLNAAMRQYWMDRAMQAGNNMTEFAAAGLLLQGTSWNTEVHVDINWPWMALPATVLVLCTLFFAAVVYESRRLGLEPWKQSILPVLFHGLANESEDLEWNELEHLRFMETRSRELLVQLKRGLDMRTVLAWSRLEKVTTAAYAGT